MELRWLAATLVALPAIATAQIPIPPAAVAEARGPRAPARETVPCELRAVVDGDTIECEELGRVRLIGIDTPELDQAPYGEMARSALVSVLATARGVTLEPDVQPRDRYGRLLAYVWHDGVMVNWTLVREGWAVLLTYPPNVQHIDALAQAQRLAREERAGLWEVGGFRCLPRERRRGRC